MGFAQHALRDCINRYSGFGFAHSGRVYEANIMTSL